MLRQHSQYDSRLGFSFRVLVRVRVSVRVRVRLCLGLGLVLGLSVFCPGFQKGRVPSEKGTLAR